MTPTITVAGAALVFHQIPVSSTSEGTVTILENSVNAHINGALSGTYSAILLIMDVGNKINYFYSTNCQGLTGQSSSSP